MLMPGGSACAQAIRSWPTLRVLIWASGE